MPHYKTKSGQNRLVFFSNELAEALEQEAAARGKSISWTVRQAALEYLERKGYFFSPFANPEGRGVRSDLRARSRDEERDIIRELKERMKKGGKK